MKYSFIVCLVLVVHAQSVLSQSNPPKFEPVVISDQADMWWARAVGDLNGDGLLDVALQNNNARGGWLGWLEAKDGGKTWVTHIIKDSTIDGGTFASGDLEVGDIDQDGDLDIIAVQHPGEWDDGGFASEIYWYKNPEWTAQRIGAAPDFIKDMNLADFNQDGKLDLAVSTFEENNLSIFRQDTPQKWTQVQNLTVKNLHEGMDVGDIDGDGDLDIAANGYWFECPGGDLSNDWTQRVIHEKWHNQTGDWSRNATKHFCRDIDGDGKVEVFISHSERSGYPVAMYKTDDPKNGTWKETVIEQDLSSTHSLQVFDFDGDGDFDVLAGINKNRAAGLDIKTFPVAIYYNQGDNKTWKKQILSDDGIYNAQVGDVDGDGDWDIFRLPTHDGKVFRVLLNQLK